MLCNGICNFQIQAVTNEYVTVEDKLRDQIASLQSALYKQQDFDKTIEDFDRWLTQTEEKVKSHMMLSIKPVVIKKQNKEQQVKTCDSCGILSKSNLLT